MNQKRIIVVRVRGHTKLRRPIKRTLQLLNLHKKNSCTIIKNTPNYVGMLTKVQDYITWGEVDESTVKNLLMKRGRLMAKKKLTEEYLKDKINFDLSAFVKEFMSFNKELQDIPGIKPFFRLNPPIKGFERKGTKKQFAMGGSLGYRKEKINELVLRML